MKCPIRFICHIHIPKTAGQCIQDALSDRHNPLKCRWGELKDSLESNPPATAVIARGHQYGSEIYISHMLAHLLRGVHARNDGRSESPLPPRPCPGKFIKKYWMKFLPEEKIKLGVTEYDDIPILSVVRNPFSRLFSIYNFYILTKQPGLQFKDFILSFEDKYFRTDDMFGTCFDHLSIENQLLTTDILKFETLSSDFKAFCKKYDLPDIQLARKNDNPNKKGTAVYTKKMIKVVERLFEKDLNEFNYSYDQFIS